MRAVHEQFILCYASLLCSLASAWFNLSGGGLVLTSKVGKPKSLDLAGRLELLRLAIGSDSVRVDLLVSRGGVFSILGAGRPEEVSGQTTAGSPSIDIDELVAEDNRRAKEEHSNRKANGWN